MRKSGRTGSLEKKGEKKYNMSLINPYKLMTKEELKQIYDDICLSDNVPKRAESLVPYATEIKENIGGDYTLQEALIWARKDFFEEVATRYFV